jgi:hypothetical protein
MPPTDDRLDNALVLPQIAAVPLSLIIYVILDRFCLLVRDRDTYTTPYTYWTLPVVEGYSVL